MSKCKAVLDGKKITEISVKTKNQKPVSNTGSKESTLPKKAVDQKTAS